MKFLQKKGATWVVAMAMLAIPGTLITSCSKDNNSAIIDSKSDKLTFSVGGIKTDNSDGISKRGSNTASNKTITASKIYSFSDVDMAVSTDNNVPVKTSSLASANRANGLAADAAPGVTENMEQDVVYVVYIYSGNTLVASKELKSGTAGTIEGLDPAGSYTWVALSYNTKDGDKPALTPANGAIALPQNKDVLYASGTVDLATNSNINILFNHAFSRIGIELNTIGVFGEITGSPSVTVSGLNLATGSIDLLTGTVSAGQTFTPTLSYADFVNIDPAHNDAKIAYVYTASTAAQSAIKVTLQNLNINHVDGNVPRTYFANATEFGFQVTPELGKSHRLLLNVIESPLETNFNGRQVKWGRSNLYYRGNNGGGRNYAFYANNTQTSKANGFFAFGSTIPGQFATTATEGDPCALVYPAGLWKQPAKADFEGMVRGDIKANDLTGALGGLGEVVDATGLTGLVNIITNLLGNTISVLVNTPAPNSSLAPSSPFNYGQYTINPGTGGRPAAGASNAFGDYNSSSNNLRFYYNGQVSNINVLSALVDGKGLLNVGLNNISADLVGVNLINTNIPLLDSYGRSTALWTHERGAEVLGLATAGTWGYYGNAGRQFSLFGLGNRFHMANNTGELLNGVSALGVDVLSTTMKNVRCVRAN
ncbi:fimbrillin family protein [Sphingobacterium thalpophilum]|uniref:fimbrillin family protein n=1 Tax=Sphingobacterium thalpophilum TaxID=259 RepID=UPI002D790B8E|nr:fimbrillin family protein [Sphingobacterium thalpophilum]